MAEERTIYRCQQCGASSPKWVGRCPGCQTWDSMVGEVVSRRAEKAGKKHSARAQAVRLSEVETAADPRVLSGISEWDRVLGGGLVPGSMVLLAGDPGIGKSTLLLQVLARLSAERAVLYVSGEESPQQLRIRAERIQVGAAGLYVLAETALEATLEALDRGSFEIVAVDSIQTMSAPGLDVSPGSISQVRECASELMRIAKQKRVSVFVVGHVTKEGAIAGPRALEHLVDTVLYLEGDRSQAFRILRAVKNRFGSTNEIGVFEMKEMGLEEVLNPSELLLAERPVDASGSVVVCSMEGTRPLLVELQALVSSTGWVQPRRTSIGIDANRLSLLLAVIEKRLGFHFGQQDVFVNVAGGVRLVEPAADLALIVAIVSSILDRPLPRDLVVWGEVGLTGEVRGVAHAALRVQEAHKLGFSKHLIPGTNAERLAKELDASCVGVRSLQEIMTFLFD